MTTALVAADEQRERALTAAYEAMRAWALGRPGPVGRPPGVALVLQRGLPAWLAAWASWIPPAAPSPARCDRPVPGPPVARSDLAVLLVNMALAPRKEHASC